MSAPRANKEDKKKKLGSRRSKAKQSEPQEADEINFMGSASVVEENTESPHVCNPDKSENETQHQPFSERTEKRRKLGSSRINRGRQNVKDAETASSHKAREVDEKPTSDEDLEPKRVSWETQFKKQEDFSQAREHETSATESSSLCSVSTSHDSEFDYVDQREDVSQMLISRSKNLKANENECTVAFDSDKFATTVLKETHTTETPLSEKVREHSQSNNMSEIGLSVHSSTDQELIYQSNLLKMPKEEQFEVHSETDKENTERCEDTDAPLLDGNLLSTNLTSESHMSVLEVCATAEITDQTEVPPADEAQCEASPQNSVCEVARGVNSTETFEIAEETLLMQIAVPVKKQVETWPASSDTVRLPDTYELNSSHMSPQVNQQPVEMPDERDDHQAISQVSSSESSLSVTQGVIIERSPSAENVGPECDVEQVAASGKELSMNEEQNENFNLTDIMENIYVSSENLETQAKFEDTQQSELRVESFDSSGTSQEGSNPDKKHEFPSKEKIFLPLEQTSKDYDSKKSHSRNPERQDTELSEVYEAEGQLEENIKTTAEQTSHEQKEGLFYEGEESNNQENLTLVSTEEQMTNFNPIGSRRKLGSRRMNRGHQQVRDSPAESCHENEEDNIGDNRSNGTTKDTLALQTIKQEETTQETVCDIIMSVTDDSSLHSVNMAGDCSQVQNTTPALCSQAALMEASENLQEANNENEADSEVEALNESLEDLSVEGAIAHSPQSKEHYARENAQTKEDQEHVDYQVYETQEAQTTDIEEPNDTGLFQLTEEDKEPTAAQTGHQGKRELWSPAAHTQPAGSTEQVRLSSPTEEWSKSEEQHVNLCEAGGAQASDDGVSEAHEPDVKQRHKQKHAAQEAAENAVFSVKPMHQAETMDSHQSNMDAHNNKPQGRNTGADTEQSEESVESQGPAEEAVHIETQDNTFSMTEQEDTDFRLMGNKRKARSRRKNKGQQQVKDFNVETATTSETEIQDTSLETMLEEADTPQTKDVRDQGEEEDAHSGTSVQSNVTDEQVMDQSGLTKVHVDESPHKSSVTHTESIEKDRDADLLKQCETLQTSSCESELKPEVSESSAALDKTRENSAFEEETGPGGRAEPAALSSPKEQNESLVLSEVTEHTQTAQGQDVECISVGENRSSVQSLLDAHGPVDSQPEVTSQNREESHTGLKSAEHRRKLGSRRTKGKQHGLDSASETDLKHKEDAGNTWGDGEVSLTTDTRQEELKQQADPGVNASEQLRNRNKGETTRKIRKEETPSSHNVVEHSITETSDVTSRSDKDDALHKHTDACDDPTENEQMKSSEAVETARSAASQRAGKEELSEEAVDEDVLHRVSSPDLPTDVHTHDRTKTGLESLIHESDSFQEEHEQREMVVESVGATSEEMEQSDCFGGKEAASSDGFTTKQDDSDSDTKHDSPTEENITKELDQTHQDHHASDEVNPQTSDAESVRTGSAHVNKSERQEEDEIKPLAEQMSHVEKEDTPSPAQDSEWSFQSLQSEIHVSVEPQTHDNSVSEKEQDNKDFRSMGSRRKLGSSRRNHGKGHGRNPESSQTPTAEASNTVGGEAEASVGTMQDPPHTEDRDAPINMPESACISIQSGSTLDQQLIDQLNSMMQIPNEEHSHVSVSDTESSERDQDTVCLKVEEVEGRESSVTLQKSRDKTCTGEETEHDWPVEQAPLSSSQKEMSTNEEPSERVTVAHHMDTAAGKVHEEELQREEKQEMDPAHYSRSSAQSLLDAHGPVDSQLEVTSQNREESHTGLKSAEHRKKLGSSRRTKGKQHGLDSASETDLKHKEDAGNTWDDGEVSSTTDTRQEELKQQADPGVNASEQLRNRNEGETTRKIRKEETPSSHNVVEHSITETSDVTSRSDKDDALHKHTDESKNLTLLTGKTDSLDHVETLMVTTKTLENRKPQPSLSDQLLQPRTEGTVQPESGGETAQSTTKDEQGPEAMKSADVPGVTVSSDVNEGANNTNFDIRNASPNFNSTNRRRKMGSTRRNLGSPSKQEPLNQKQDTPEPAGGAGHGLSGNASGTTWLQPQKQHQESESELKEENGGEEHSSISESQFKAVVYQTDERVPDSPSEETRPQVSQDHLATKPSTSPEQDDAPESSNGGRRRKFGSNRKSRGNYGDQTAREDRTVEAPKDGGSTEEQTNNGGGREESVGLDKQETSNVQINEGDRKLSSNVSAAGESQRPGSEKAKQVAPYVGINLSHKSFSLAGDSTEADVRSRGYNVLMVGDTSVGKTSFMKRAQSGKFSLDLPSSVGLDSCMWTVVVDGKRVVLHLWDTAGQERFHSITRQIFHKAQAFLLMYDVTSSKSFSAVSYWANCIQEGAAENVCILLLGNKSDCVERQVKTRDGESLAKEYKFDFMECSAATGQNVIECLETIARTLTQRTDTSQEAVALEQEPRPKKRSGCC
ncbi:uncharacterized protein rab44 [Betta splendens]|uniref:Uncharacterized protein rab44 n=1 Tax=Betta splendens TaxID=158456 RepID=A0A6P7MGZ8_BETSP|nr:uncharacterized protein rab44 [Betta splendens]